MEPENTTEHTPKKVTISVPAAIITGAAIIALALAFTLHPKEVATQKQDTNDRPETPTSVSEDIAQLQTDDYIKGDRNADIIVIEYSDSDCPYCQRFHTTMQQVVTDYEGTVAWVYRFFPLSIHPNAYTEALATSCVGELGGEKQFWSYLDTVMNLTLNADPKSNETLTTLATQQGIDASLLRKCIADPQSSKKIDAQITEIQASGAKGTPFSIVVNVKTGKQIIIPGAYPIEKVKEFVDSLLE